LTALTALRMASPAMIAAAPNLMALPRPTLVVAMCLRSACG